MTTSPGGNANYPTLSGGGSGGGGGPAPGRTSILSEREKTHGSFITTAQAAQSIKNTIGKHDIHGLPPSQREALDMIATKIARILCGNNLEPDHWKDIAGYAELGREACR